MNAAPDSTNNQSEQNSNSASSNRQDTPSITFDALQGVIKEAAIRAGWTDLMPVQSRTIPYFLAGKDVMVQSKTGSGKTGAFLLPLVEMIDTTMRASQALILVPTRELAVQVRSEADVIFRDTGIEVVAVYGGVGYKNQLDAFNRGAQLVVGTPGRILDHLLKRSLTLDRLRFLIFDEADRMLSMGFYPDMKRIREYLPQKPLNAYMFSATYPAHVMRLAGQFLTEPTLLSLSRDTVHVAETEHAYMVVPAMEKDRSLVRMIEIENPQSAIIFCNTKAKVDYVATVLQRFGYDADQLSADLSQSARERVLNRVREGTLRFLVATDVAARGIDIPELSHVIQYEVHDDFEMYIHRMGRTGRAGAFGEAISLVDSTEESRLHKIARHYKIDLIRKETPSDADVSKIVSERLITMLEARLRDRDKLQTERMQRFVPLARTLGQSDEESQLVAMLLDDLYQISLHAPPVRIAANQEHSQPPQKGGKRRRSASRTRKDRR